MTSPEGYIHLYACQCGLTLCLNPREYLECCRKAGIVDGEGKKPEETGLEDNDELEGGGWWTVWLALTVVVGMITLMAWFL